MKNLKVLVCIFSFWVLFKNISYSVYEYKVNHNIIGSLAIVILNIIGIIFINTVLFFSK